MENNNCSSCGGKLEYSPDDRALKCLECGKIYTVDFQTSPEKRPIAEKKKQEGFQEWANTTRTFQCSNCGAQVVLDKFDMGTNCEYCNTTSLVPYESLPGLRPDVVVPFRLSKARARDEFKNRIRHKWFVPNKFKKTVEVSKMGALYISAFDFAVHDYATYHGTESYTVSYRDKNGQMKTITKFRPISGDIDKQFNNLVVEANDKISQDDIRRILPFNFNEGFKYASDFIKGYRVSYYNQTVDDSYLQAESMAKNMVVSAIKSRYNTVVSLTVDHNLDNQRYNYCLLPIYFINFNYKDKQYLNLMNGQTGNIGGKVPRSAIKISLFVIMLLLIFVGVPLLIGILT